MYTSLDTNLLQLFPECNQLEDPRQQHLRDEQEHMLKDYLIHAQQDVAVSHCIIIEYSDISLAVGMSLQNSIALLLMSTCF